MIRNWTLCVIVCTSCALAGCSDIGLSAEPVSDNDEHSLVRVYHDVIIDYAHVRRPVDKSTIELDSIVELPADRLIIAPTYTIIEFSDGSMRVWRNELDIESIRDLRWHKVKDTPSKPNH